MNHSINPVRLSPKYRRERRTADPARLLLFAVLDQAMRDHQSATYRGETTRFYQSDGFVWLWENLTEEVMHLEVPSISEARAMLLSGNVTVGRKPYHTEALM